MRSRYCAYALGNEEYIITSTHPLHHDFQKDLTQWREEIKAFCHHETFKNLEILDVQEGENLSFVTFRATLDHHTFTEKSRFLKSDGRWLYESGEFL